MKKEIDINNEEQILKECDFDYLYRSEKCSLELCCFYNDIIYFANKKRSGYDVNLAFVDLGRIAITLNKQSARIKELEDENGYIIFADGYDDNGNEVNKQVYTTYKSKCDELIKENQQLKIENGSLRKKISTQLQNNADNVDFMENQRREIEQLKQSQNQKAIEELEKLKSAILSERNTTYFKFDNFNKGKDTAYYWANEIIDNQIKSLKGEK